MRWTAWGGRHSLDLTITDRHKIVGPLLSSGPWSFFLWQLTIFGSHCLLVLSDWLPLVLQTKDQQNRTDNFVSIICADISQKKSQRVLLGWIFSHFPSSRLRFFNTLMLKLSRHAYQKLLSCAELTHKRGHSNRCSARSNTCPLVVRRYVVLCNAYQTSWQ